MGSAKTEPKELRAWLAICIRKVKTKKTSSDPSGHFLSNLEGKKQENFDNTESHYVKVKGYWLLASDHYSISLGSAPSHCQSVP